MRQVTLAATQMPCTWKTEDNIARAEALVRRAASDGAQIILLQELFEAPYFCSTQAPEFFDLARPVAGNPLIAHFSTLARELGVVLPISFFERAGQAFFNSMVVADADGQIVGHYRKTHIPQNPGYEEKYYFSHGDLGLQVIDTAFGRIGCAICWDQWFPEVARTLALKGAEILIYPTAIGSEPSAPDVDSAGHWQRVMQGHSGANLMPVIASNRIGRETVKGMELNFYGSSFITDGTGAFLAQADRETEGHITATVDLDALAHFRAEWCVFRDRRPEVYRAMHSLDGRSE